MNPFTRSLTNKFHLLVKYANCLTMEGQQIALYNEYNY